MRVSDPAHDEPNYGLDEFSMPWKDNQPPPVDLTGEGANELGVDEPDHVDQPGEVCGE